ncbi:PA0069 family radical SAM protein [Aliiroseovarius sp. YM-037]|uniref:PA0069 family radical SAM protein n=1 Tax=Aliiroseovarius sp. YM-037 TaxID=3341728 RepID=UPI003A7FC4F9
MTARDPQNPRIGTARGRGARTNRAGRYERFAEEVIDDGWPGDGEALPPLRTVVTEEAPRSALNYNSSPDLPFDRSVNPYRGCEHGCIYCYARPGHAWLGMSPGLDFETRLIARPTMPSVLAKELGRRSYNPATIAIGTYTDPYQPIERERKIMRGILEVLAAHRHPVAIVTKGTLIERDIDILSSMAAQNLVRVGVSVTTLDRDIARRMEPRVPPPARRLQVIRRLTDAGIPVRVMASPLVPGLTDHELEAILTAGKENGATAASWIMLRLPQEVSPLVQEWLAEHFPNRAAGVMARLREMHGGKDYDAAWGRRMRGEGQYAEMVAHRFALSVRRLGLLTDLSPLRADLFQPPGGRQLELF